MYVIGDPVTAEKYVSNQIPHTAKNLFFGCIDDRLVESHLNFIIKLGGAFYPAVAGGGLAFISDTDRDTALKQVAAAYKINRINHVYLESHTDCGAYGLAGVTFKDSDDEVARLYADLETAAGYVREALRGAGAADGEVTIHTRVVDPSGQEIRPLQTA